ncbi:MAG: hypothetical protein Q9165_001141 [Trypethelium subeluteriae]
MCIGRHEVPEAWADQIVCRSDLSNFDVYTGGDAVEKLVQRTAAEAPTAIKGADLLLQRTLSGQDEDNACLETLSTAKAAEAIDSRDHGACEGTSEDGSEDGSENGSENEESSAAKGEGLGSDQRQRGDLRLNADLPWLCDHFNSICRDLK